jgi:hypothetical protein
VKHLDLGGRRELAGAMSWPVPTPALPIVILPGCVFARATSSCTLLTGSDGCTIRMFGWFTSRIPA